MITGGDKEGGEQEGGEEEGGEEEGGEEEGGEEAQLAQLVSRLPSQTVLQAINHYSINRVNKAKEKIYKAQTDFDEKIFFGAIKIQFGIKNCLNLRSTLRLGKDGDIRTRLKTQFKFKPSASDMIQVSSLTTADEVIRYFLSQFRVQEPQQYFQLYERQTLAYDPRSGEKMRDPSAGTFRRLARTETPLQLSLAWQQGGLAKKRKLVLCDHDPRQDPQQSYDTKTDAELELELATLDKEQEEELAAIRIKYKVLLQMHQTLIEQKQRERKKSAPAIAILDTEGEGSGADSTLRRNTRSLSARPMLKQQKSVDKNKTMNLCKQS